MGRNVIVTLRPGAGIYVGPAGNADGTYELNSVSCQTGFAPWPSSPDLLIDSRSRELCGVVYQIAQEHEVETKVFSLFLDPKVARYTPGLTTPGHQVYAGVENINLFEISWSRQMGNEIVPAQLGCDFWYYSGAPMDGTDFQRAVAFGVGDLEELLSDHNLIMPVEFSVLPPLSVIQR